MQTMRPGWRSRVLRALPGQLLRPLGYLPRPVTRQGFVALCNQVFATALAEGELAFLEGRVLRIVVEDAGIELAITGAGNCLWGHPGSSPVDVSICGTAHDLLLLISRREDPDTLFFQRRLRLEGGTELGLHLKNFLDAWQPPVAVQWLQKIADAWLTVAEPVSVTPIRDSHRISAVDRLVR